jgi:glycine/D-amino acid oxidase-like deaminating enzyme
MWWWRSPARAVLVAAEPDAALLSAAAALRRLGARITRYDSEAGTLEAQVPPSATVRVRTAEAEDGATRVLLEGDGAARGVIRRFRAALSA